MSKIIDQCPLCGGDFMYDPSTDDKLQQEVVINDLGETQPCYICWDCYDKRSQSQDVNVDGHRLCSVKGCASDAEQSRYCHYHADELYGNKNETEPQMRSNEKD